MPVKNKGYPLFAPFLTLFGENGVNKGALMGGGTCAPEPLPRSPEAVLRSDGARVSKIMPQEGGGVALGAHVGHVVTNHGSPDGSLIYTVFTKKC